MIKKVIGTSGNPVVTVDKCLGDLVIRGSEESQVVLRGRGGENDLRFSQDGDTITVTSYADCIISCPHNATLDVNTVRGDFKVKGFVGALNIGTVNGDISLRDVGPVVLEQVYGDFRAQEVAGDLRGQDLLGGVRAISIAGQLVLEEISGDLRAEAVLGGLDATVGSDVRLGPPFSPGALYRIQAGSDLRVNVPADASLRVSLVAGGRVRSRIEDLVLAEIDGRTEGEVGAGEAALEADVGGHVYLRAMEPSSSPEVDFDFSFTTDLEDLGSVIEMRISEAMSEMETRLQDSLGQIDSETIRARVEHATDRARQAASRAAEVARREMERERLRAEREAERARLRKERAERRWKRVSGRPPAPPKPTVSDEERMRVLHMVEDGKITPEQAAELLAALEGR